MNKTNQIEKHSENEASLSKTMKHKPATSIFNKIAKKPSSDLTHLNSTINTMNAPNALNAPTILKMSRNVGSNAPSNPYDLRSQRNSSIFQTTVDDTSKLTKLNSQEKINNNEQSSFIKNTASSGNSVKNKVSLGKYSHVFGDADDRDRLTPNTNKFDTTRSITTTRITKNDSNLGLNVVSVNNNSNTEADEGNYFRSNILKKSNKRNSVSLEPFNSNIHYNN